MLKQIYSFVIQERFWIPFLILIFLLGISYDKYERNINGIYGVAMTTGRIDREVYFTFYHKQLKYKHKKYEILNNFDIVERGGRYLVLFSTKRPQNCTLLDNYGLIPETFNLDSLNQLGVRPEDLRWLN